jgi:hypothetical protein
MARQGMTSFGGKALLEGALPVAGANRYVGLLKTLPTDHNGTGLVEASGSGYARILYDDWIALIDADGIPRIKNSSAVKFALLTGTLTSIIGWGIWDAVSSGNLIAFGSMPLAPQVDFASGVKPVLPAQLLVISVMNV